MRNPLDNATYKVVNNTGNNFTIQQAYQNAMKNPKAFIEQLKANNPQLVQRAMQLANSSSPQNVVMQILQSRGINPALFNIPGYN